MALVRPRLTDFYGISAAQAEIDFAIPFLMKTYHCTLIPSCFGVLHPIKIKLYTLH
jgi:hypothetical protein